MVSGFFTSPHDHERIRSGEASEILIASKFCGCDCWLNRFRRSFIYLSPEGANTFGKAGSDWHGTRDQGPEEQVRDRFAFTGTGSRVPGPDCHRSSSSMSIASERISLTSTLNDSGMPAAILCSPSTMDLYIWLRPCTSSDFTVSISCSV